MKTENKIVTLFIGEKKSNTIREIARKIKSDYNITHTAVQRLLHKKILLSETIGKSTLCKLNNSYFGVEIYKAENQRKIDLLKNKNIKQLSHEIMSRLKTSFFTFLLFGSYAKNTQTKNSDIDIMIISNNKNTEHEIDNLLALIPLKIHNLVFTEEEFIRMKDSKELNVVKEAIANNIILYGIENYYKLKND